jgi:hypothetical protein
MTRNALWLVLAAGVGLSVCGLLPWYQFEALRVKGTQTHIATGFGDGYLLTVAGVLCVAAATWMLRRGALNAISLVTVLASATLAFGIAASSLTYAGEVCFRNPQLGYSYSRLSCTFGAGGDVFFTSGEGHVLGYLWAGTALAFFTALAALALPMIEDFFYEEYEISEEAVEAWT